MSEIVNEGNEKVVPADAPVPAAELPKAMPYGPVNGVEVIDQTDHKDFKALDENGVFTRGEPNIGREGDSPHGRAGQPPGRSEATSEPTPDNFASQGVAYGEFHGDVEPDAPNADGDGANGDDAGNTDESEAEAAEAKPVARKSRKS